MLPHVDEHRVMVEAPPERVWVALGASLSRTFGRASRTFGAPLCARLRIEPIGAARTRLPGETCRAFPHTHGHIYRTLVIGTRAHALAVRRRLKATKRRAERLAA